MPTAVDVSRPMRLGYSWTGQRSCYDVQGLDMACQGSGQDAEFRTGTPWPEPRFTLQGATVLDHLTGLVWSRDANPAEFPLSWPEALAFVQAMNDAQALGHGDWRLPNRRELRSLVSHQTRKPALPEGYPFQNVFLGWYWSSTTAVISPGHAWYLHMEGARLFYGGKDQSFLVWPVRGDGNGLLPVTGQTACYDMQGERIACAGSGQDGEQHKGRAWPRPRFIADEEALIDRLTGLVWCQDADLTCGPVTWEGALDAIDNLNRTSATSGRWRLPNIHELESLVDSERHSPALPADAAFMQLREAYWSSTTSLFEPDWAWALYLDKGAVGVGQKKGAHFHVWAVSDMAAPKVQEISV